MRIDLTRRAIQDLDRLERRQPEIYGKIIAKIESLSDNPKAGKPLVGPLKGKWSLRVGDWRILYELEKAAITILTVSHRREVYR